MAENEQTAKKHWRIVFNAPVVLVFVALCVIATALNYATAGVSNRLIFVTYHSSLADPLTYVRFFTHVLGHSGWEHLLGNMIYILLLGPLLEEKYGSRALIVTIAATGLATGLINYIFFPTVALCGASGVVFAFIIMSSITSARSGEIPVTFILVVAVFLGQQIYQGLFVDNNISELSHIIGGIVGAIFGFVLNRRKSAAAPKLDDAARGQGNGQESDAVRKPATFADAKIEKIERFYMDE